MLEEINIAFSNECYMSASMLIRGVLDHIPPVFEVGTFSQVSTNASGLSKSFKESMDHLDKSMRKIADSCLHSHIRARESLPAKQQVVGFQADVDVLLAEVIRRLQQP
ncbi:hypothetical protein XarbCFBP8150_00560 [Xanthomonas arboricola]|nr:hypothetical protein XarbCFBP8150_00560 [Xanthomonas arboricola]